MIFMEFCDGGTIEEMAIQGLPEDLIRTYTREILIAINVLHEHGIAHRDIKGNQKLFLSYRVLNQTPASLTSYM